MNTLDLKIQLFRQFMDTMNKIKKLVASDSSCIDMAITDLQIQALEFIHQNGTVNVGMLAKELCMSSSSVAQLIERLETSQLILRKNDQKDKRVVMLSLTEKGKANLANMTEKRLSKIKTVIEYMPMEDLETMVTIHKNLLEKLEKSKK